MSEERQDFKKWQVDIVYSDVQEGQCSRCPASLENTGFHKHHKDKNPANNEISNLELLCPRCHHSLAGLSNPYTEHREQERLVLQKINLLVNQILEPQVVKYVDSKGVEQSKVLELSGVVLDKLVDVLSLSLKVSKNVTDVDYGIQYTPAIIKLQRKMAEQEAMADKYIEGYMQAVKDTLSKVELKK